MARRFLTSALTGLLAATLLAGGAGARAPSPVAAGSPVTPQSTQNTGIRFIDAGTGNYGIYLDPPGVCFYSEIPTSPIKRYSVSQGLEGYNLRVTTTKGSYDIQVPASVPQFQ